MHADCYVKSGKPFAKLPRHQMEMLPYFPIKAAGRLPELEALLVTEYILSGQLVEG